MLAIIQPAPTAWIRPPRLETRTVDQSKRKSALRKGWKSEDRWGKACVRWREAMPVVSEAVS